MQAAAEAQEGGATGQQPPPAEAVFDSRFEFDAPRFYDFGTASPQGEGAADNWFETSATKGLASPQGTSDAAQEAQSKQEQQKEAPGAAQGGRGKLGKGAGAASRPALAPITNAAPVSAAAGQPAAKRQLLTRAAAAAQGTAAGSGDGHSGAQGAAGTKAVGAQPAEAAKQAAGAADTSKPGAPVAAAKAAPPRHRSTVQASPHLRARLRSCGHEVKSSEELEVERLQQEKEEAARLRKRNAEAVKAVLQPPPPPAVHSTKPLTKPVGVELRTAKRQRQHSMATRSTAGGDGAEMPAPDDSQAAAAQAKPANTAAGPAATGPLTMPKSPKFETKRRARPPRFKPREVVEEEEMAAMPKFRARPMPKFDNDAAQAGVSVPWVAPKPPTAPEPFHFATADRATAHGGISSAAPPEPFVFQAQADAGGRVTTRSRAKKHQWTGQLTNPQPFALATDARAGAKRGVAEEEHQEARQAKWAKRGAAAAAAAGPFHLETDARGELGRARLEQQLHAEEERRRRDAEFRARPLSKAALERPFVVAPASTDLTVPHNMPLATEGRATARRAFDAQQAQRQVELAAQQAEEEELRQHQEAEDIKQYRQQLVHKARPAP